MSLAAVVSLAGEALAVLTSLMPPIPFPPVIVEFVWAAIIDWFFLVAEVILLMQENVRQLFRRPSTSAGQARPSYLKAQSSIPALRRPVLPSCRLWHRGWLWPGTATHHSETLSSAPDVEEWTYPGAGKGVGNSGNRYGNTGKPTKLVGHSVIWMTPDAYNKVIAFYYRATD